MGEKREGQRKKEERVCVPEENQVGVLGPIVYSFVFQRLNEQDISKKEKKKKKKKSEPDSRKTGVRTPLDFFIRKEYQFGNEIYCGCFIFENR